MGVEGAGLLERIDLKGVGPAEEMTASLAPRLNLFTGDNGLGKSFLLETAWRGLTGAWPGNQALPRDAMLGAIRFGYGDDRILEEPVLPGLPFLPKRSSRKGKPTSDTGVGILIAANGDASIFIGEGATKSVGGSKILHVPFSDIFDGLKSRSRQFRFQGLIADWGLWQYRNDPDFEVFRRVVRCLSPDREPIELGEPKRLAVDDSRLIPTLTLPYGEVPLTHASAGMRRIVALSYLLVWAVREHRFVVGNHEKPINLAFVIDEIEAHLHPAWQRLVLPALFGALESLPVPVRAQLFVTTHSPMVMASTEPLCREPLDRLFLFELEEGQVRLSPQPWEKQGDASAWLKSDLFGLDEARNKPAEDLVKDLDGVMNADELPEADFKVLDQRVADLLPDEDPLRARWTVWKWKREGRL